MNKKLYFLLVFFLPIILFSQETENIITKSFYGYVKTDVFWDSRQTVSAREGHLILFPSPVFLDPDGNDINNVPNFNILAVQSRIGVKITGAKALNADVSAVIEGDYFGQANDNINLLRLRHAFVLFKWTSTELLFGQYWIPMFVPECFPYIESFGAGLPFQPFGRSPQIRFTQKFGNFKFLAIANSQRDFSNIGLLGASSSYLRNSGMPEFASQLHF